MKTVTVNAEALGELLGALTGPAHYVREIQATRGPIFGEKNCINLLIAEYNAAAEKHNEELKT